MGSETEQFSNQRRTVRTFSGEPQHPPGCACLCYEGDKPWCSQAVFPDERERDA